MSFSGDIDIEQVSPLNTGKSLVDRLCLCTLSANPSPNKGGVRVNIWHLKVGSSEQRNGNPNRRAPGPPGWGL